MNGMPDLFHLIPKQVIEEYEENLIKVKAAIRESLESYKQLRKDGVEVDTILGRLIEVGMNRPHLEGVIYFSVLLSLVGEGDV